MKTCYTRERIEAAVKSKGYKWFEDHNDKGYDVNIVGVRNSATKNKVTNKFDDCIIRSDKCHFCSFFQQKCDFVEFLRKVFLTCRFFYKKLIGNIWISSRIFGVR